VMSGIPGLSDLPVIGALFANNHRETQETDIILTLTPRIVRVLNLSADDLAAFRVGRDSGAPLIEIPLPGPIPAPARPPGDVPESGTIVPPAPVAPTSPLLPVPQPAQPVKPPPKPPPAP
jgi:general secretion pathway protein D